MVRAVVDGTRDLVESAAAAVVGDPYEYFQVCLSGRALPLEQLSWSQYSS
ncbi:MAG: hypothetical protein JWM19_2046 [Actinomycetia bacterium]|nr:hypothetical protein [Actinomycetes bacterium]